MYLLCAMGNVQSSDGAQQQAQDHWRVRDVNKSRNHIQFQWILISDLTT